MKLIKTTQPGIYYVQNKNGVSYYHSWKDKTTKQTKRKKLFSKDNHLQKHIKECINQINELKEDLLNNNTNIIAEDETIKNYITLNKLAELYFNHKYERKKRLLKEQYNHLTEEEFLKFQVVKRKLYNQYNESLRYKKNVETSNIGKLPLNKLNRTEINNFIENYLGNSSLSSKSKFNIISQIKTIINWGIKSNITNIQNPFEKIQFRNPMKQRERVLSENELKKLLQKCKEYKTNRNVYLSVYLAVMTAARSNSILNIKKKDIDIENKTISIYNFKSSKQFKLQLTNESIEWLKDKILPYYEPNEYLIRPTYKRNRKDQPLFDIPKKVYDIMDELFNQGLDKKNNLDRDKVVNFHTIRRSIATNLVKRGVSVYNVMILLNHSSVEQTMKYLNTTHNNLDSDVSKLMGDIFTDFKL